MQNLKWVWLQDALEMENECLCKMRPTSPSPDAQQKHNTFCIIVTSVTNCQEAPPCPAPTPIAWRTAKAQYMLHQPKAKQNKMLKHVNIEIRARCAWNGKWFARCLSWKNNEMGNEGLCKMRLKWKMNCKMRVSKKSWNGKWGSLQDALEMENELQDACLEKRLKWKMSVFARCAWSAKISKWAIRANTQD